ncbi:unnamed protein product [Moneuplotes crassus]|uniref:Uncharacterized protein n=1 Tax=Euplotes crassus TaxID=5936 RepID=A0AAD2D1R6_EUPCR|nr:unnamed protein product [Moneuplotes crassus]
MLSKSNPQEATFEPRLRKRSRLHKLSKAMNNNRVQGCAESCNSNHWNTKSYPKEVLRCLSSLAYKVNTRFFAARQNDGPILQTFLQEFLKYFLASAGVANLGYLLLYCVKYNRNNLFSLPKLASFTNLVIKKFRFMNLRLFRAKFIPFLTKFLLPWIAVGVMMAMLKVILIAGTKFMINPMCPVQSLSRSHMKGALSICRSHNQTEGRMNRRQINDVNLENSQEPN